jgi:hypothetical protein
MPHHQKMPERSGAIRKTLPSAVRSMVCGIKPLSQEQSASWGFSEYCPCAPMDSLDQRFRPRSRLSDRSGDYRAAALRHGVHIYGGIPREEIREGALMAIPVRRRQR